MLGNTKNLNQSSYVSCLDACSTLAPSGERRQKTPAASLMLTSLIDAFSILVIYLLVNMSNSEQVLKVDKSTELPSAQRIAELKKQTVVKVEGAKIYVGEKEVTSQALVGELLEARKKFAEEMTVEPSAFPAIVQADRRTQYRVLSEIVQALSHAGYAEINFAALKE